MPSFHGRSALPETVSHELLPKPFPEISTIQLKKMFNYLVRSQFTKKIDEKCSMRTENLIWEEKKRKKANTFFISNKVEGLIKRFINNSFDINNAKFPKSICGTYRLTLNESDKGIIKRPLSPIPSYTDFNVSTFVPLKKGRRTRKLLLNFVRLVFRK